MITPQFSVSQDDQRVHIKIKAPYIKAAGVEFFVDKDLFIFSLHPYYLRLRFPGNLKEDRDDEDEKDVEKSKASYDVASSIVSVTIPKEKPGEQFPDLDMITKLLARKEEDTSAAQEQTTKPLIQEIGGSQDDVGASNEILKSAEKFDWEIEQQVPEPLGEEEPTASILGAKYGFNDQYSGEIPVSIMSGNDLNEILEPEKDGASSRVQQRIDAENDQFDEDHYLADFMDNPDIPEYVRWELPIPSGDFSEAEQLQMTKLPKKHYLLDNPKQIYIGLVGIVFAYAYDQRTTLGESTVESAWTIGKLAPLVAALDNSFTALAPLVISCSRRALAFPLFRHWDLVTKVWEDTYSLLKAAAEDKKVIVKVLLHVISLFDATEHCYYVYNKIWFLDYASWVQQSNQTVIRSLASELHKVSLTKEAIGWDLEELERAAMEVDQQQS
ncbi:protein Shq1p [Trichomonascus vanleenenianus]|uniref:Hsp90 cochaperone SHQ1 n=1 Tax=Trichomonascus vanleenenianus TaxID=2268995 RepID=UPI003ECAFF7D